MTMTTTTTCGIPNPMFQPPNNQQICNGHGYCISNSSADCICDPGWLNVGDMRSPYFKELCTTNIDAVFSLYIICAITNFLTTIYGVIFLYGRYQDTKARWADTKILGIFSLISSISYVIMAIRRASSLTTTIGQDPTATFFYGLASSTFWASLVMNILIFFRVHSSMIKFNKDKRNLALKRLTLELYAVGTFSCMANIISPLIMLGMTREEDFYILTLTTYLSSSVASCFVGVIAVPFFVKEMDELISQVIAHGEADNNNMSSEVREQMETVREKMKSFKRDTFINGGVNFILISFMGFWPFIQAAGSVYWLPLVLGTAVPFQLFQQMQLSIPVKKNSSSRVKSNDALGSSPNSPNSKNSHYQLAVKRDESLL
jgi:hypothetical protein